MIKFVHLIYVPFTGVGIYNNLNSKDWLADRIEIFKKYTLQSIFKQTNRAFLLWLSFRPEEEKHPLVTELLNYLKGINMPTILTFNGLVYWDDKFSRGPKNVVMNLGRIARQCWREKDFSKLIPASFQLLKNPNKTLLKRLELTINDLSQVKEFHDANYVYMTRIDSDDMFHHETVAEIQKIMPFEGAIIVKNGYIYNTNTNEMATWNPTTNPPFHTIIFLGSHFFNPIAHLRYYKNFRSHEDIPKIFKTQELSDGKYCVVVHKNHISTVWNHKFRGEAVDVSKLNEFI